jgi:CysZ protein
MIASARRAANIVFDPVFLRVVLKAAGLTLLLFLVLFAAAQYGLHLLAPTHVSGPDALIPLATVVIFGLIATFLGPPVAALFATLFVEDIAKAIEAKDYPNDPPAIGTSFWQSVFVGLRLFGWIVLLNLLLLPIELLLPGPGTLLGLLVNGWLLGREYFELVALRHGNRETVDAARRRHSWAVTAAGAMIAVLSAVPIVNLVAPLFGVALMVHEFKRYTSEDKPA